MYARQNKFNQISIMGVNLLGNPLHQQQSQMPKKPHHDDLGFLMYTDPDIVEVSIFLRKLKVTLLNTRPFF